MDAHDLATLPATTTIPSERPASSPNNRKLQRLEKIIADGLPTTLRVGEALRTIRREKLYRIRGFKSFNEYCFARWRFSAKRAHQIVAHAEIAERVSTDVDIPAPTNEAQTRPLAKFPPADQKNLWREACRTAPDGKPPTQAHVESVVHRTTASKDWRAGWWKSQLGKVEKILVDLFDPSYGDPDGPSRDKLKEIRDLVDRKLADTASRISGDVDLDVAAEPEADESAQHAEEPRA